MSTGETLPNPIGPDQNGRLAFMGRPVEGGYLADFLPDAIDYGAEVFVADGSLYMPLSYRRGPVDEESLDKMIQAVADSQEHLLDPPHVVNVCNAANGRFSVRISITDKEIRRYLGREISKLAKVLNIRKGLSESSFRIAETDSRERAEEIAGHASRLLTCNLVVRRPKIIRV